VAELARQRGDATHERTRDSQDMNLQDPTLPTFATIDEITFARDRSLTAASQHCRSAAWPTVTLP
jgi:hypothetical protein